ncbi:MAG: flagellar biosynthetic protein FliR [Pirellulales bacterium]|nr:flagellar biosynthetic protein FliR [Pirellulales bacterium]
MTGAAEWQLAIGPWHALTALQAAPLGQFVLPLAQLPRLLPLGGLADVWQAGILWVYLLVLARISGLVIVGPVLGGPELPAQVRVLLAVALTLLVAPLQSAGGAYVPRTLWELLLAAAGELAIGVALGMGVVALLAGLQLAGQIVGQASGLSLAEVFNPTLETSVPIFSQLWYVLGVALFVVVGGHRLVIAGLLETLAAIPPGSAGLELAWDELASRLASQSLALGIRAAAPSLAAVMLATLVLGLIGRTLPQLNLLVMGFGLNALATLWVLAASLAGTVWLLEAELEPTVETVLQVLTGY